MELSAWSTKQIKREPGSVARIAAEIDKADFVLLYRTSDDFWEELEQVVLDVKDRVPVVVVGPEPSFSALSNVNPEITATVYRYILFGGAGNMRNMLGYLRASFSEECDLRIRPSPCRGRAFTIRPSPACSPDDGRLSFRLPGVPPLRPGVFCGHPLLALQLGQ